MQLYRSNVNYKSILDGDREGYNLGLDGAMFLKEETTPRTFNPPSIGTQGSSIGGNTAPSEDISAGSDNKLDVTVDGVALGDVAVVVAGLNTGPLIAAALVSAINTALIAAGSDKRVWGQWETDHYEFYSQQTGVASSVVIADASVDNLADDLELGLANGGNEAVGVDDEDFLLYTTGGPTFNQPIEPSPHRSGRFYTPNVVKQKKVVELSFQTLVNMQGAAGDSLDKAVRLLWESLLGSETVTPSVSIDYRQALPNKFFSLVRVSTIFAEYYTGCFVNDMTMTFPGDGVATEDWSGAGATRLIAGIARVDGAVVANDTATVDAGHELRYDLNVPVMIVAADGRTITAGADGSLTVLALDEVLHTVQLSAAVDIEDNGYIAPWHPGAVQQTARENIYTDLEGSFKFDYKAPSSNICVTNIVLGFTNNHTLVNNCFGTDGNQGFVAGSRMDMNLAVTVDLSNENFAEVVQTSKFNGFSPEIILGNSASGRYLRIRAEKWITAVPTIEVPEEGTTPVTLEGSLHESSAGAQDPVVVSYR
jgi:hypothetical protein